MYDLESQIRSAWQTVAPTLDQHALAKRLARRRRPSLTRPPRAWCIAVRASDHRIHTGYDQPTEHQVTLTAATLQQLITPVHLSRDLLDEAAEKLGISIRGLVNARIKGTIRADHYPHLAGRRGRPIPLLTSDHPLDASSRHFAQPDRAWGWTARSLGTRIPKDFQTALTRIPYFRAHVWKHQYDDDRHPELDPPQRGKSNRLPEPPPDAVWYKWSRSGHFLGTDPSNWRKSPQDLGERPRRDLPKKTSRRKPRPSQSDGSAHFNGFHWLCPVCNRKTRILYLPLPPLNLLKDIPRLAQVVDIPRKIQGFACDDCHRIQHFSRVQNEAWNDVISHLTQGLLYGSEVPKPDWFTPDRKRPYKPLLRPAPRREKVFAGLLKGHTRAQIAADLHMTDIAVSLQIWKIFKQEKVRTQRALLIKHARPLPLRLQYSTEKILTHLKAGHSQEEIARLMHMTKQAVQSYTSKLRKSGQIPKRTFKRDAVARLHAEHLKPKEIAAELGLSVQNVYDHLHELRRISTGPNAVSIAGRRALGSRDVPQRCE